MRTCMSAMTEVPTDSVRKDRGDNKEEIGLWQKLVCVFNMQVAVSRASNILHKAALRERLRR